MSFHDAFPYFAAAYGLTIDGTWSMRRGRIRAPAQIAALVARTAKAASRRSSPRRSSTRTSSNTIVGGDGRDRRGPTCTPTASGDPPQDTYEGLMRWNVERVVAALGG